MVISSDDEIMEITPEAYNHDVDMEDVDPHKDHESAVRFLSNLRYKQCAKGPQPRPPRVPKEPEHGTIPNLLLIYRDHDKFYRPRRPQPDELRPRKAAAKKLGPKAKRKREICYIAPPDSPLEGGARGCG